MIPDERTRSLIAQVQYVCTYVIKMLSKVFNRRLNGFFFSFSMEKKSTHNGVYGSFIYSWFILGQLESPSNKVLHGVCTVRAAKQANQFLMTLEINWLKLDKLKVGIRNTIEIHVFAVAPYKIKPGHVKYLNLMWSLKRGYLRNKNHGQHSLKTVMEESALLKGPKCLPR